MTPMPISGKPQDVCGVQNRKSHDMAISTPAPRMVLCAARMIGFSMVSISS